MTIMVVLSWNTFLVSARLVNTLKFLPHPPRGRATLRHIFTRSLSPNGRQAPTIGSLHDAPLEIAHNKLDDYHHLMPSSLELYEIFLLMLSHGNISNPVWKHHTHI